MLREVLIKLLELACVTQAEPGKYVVDLGTCDLLDYAGPYGSGQLHTQPLELTFTVVGVDGKDSIVDASVDYRYSTTTPQGEGGIFGSSLEGYIHRSINTITHGLLEATAFDDELTIQEVIPTHVERPEGYEDYWRSTLYIQLKT